MTKPASDLYSLFVSFIYLWILTPSAGDDLTTLAPMPRFLKTPTNVTFNKGEDAILQCAIQNIGTRTVVWRRASDPNPLTIGKTTYFRDKRLFVKHEKLSLEWNLHIRNVSLKDAGVYECQISSKTRSIRHNVLLRVDDKPIRPTYKPDIKITGLNFIEKGNRLKLVCNATGDGYPSDAIDWFKDGHKISEDGRLHIGIDVSLAERNIISTLDIERAEMTDAGTYVCRTSELQITSAKVNILNTQTNNEKRASGPTFIEKGDRLRLVCNATRYGYPPDALDWFKDGRRISADGRLDIRIDVSLARKTIISTLHIERAEMSDAGMYVCRMSAHQITSTEVIILNSQSNKTERGVSSHAESPCTSYRDLMCLTLVVFFLFQNRR